MTIEKKLLGTNPVSGEVLPEAVSFDGAKGTNNATDYLSRTTPLSNQADSKTFTFSTWAWLDGANGGLLYLGNNRFFITFEGGGDYFKCEGRDANNTRHLRFEAPTGLVPVNTWVNILMSFDMSDTSKRHIYINEVDITSATFTGSFPTYTNGTLDFTPAASSGADMTYRIGAQYNAQSKLGGRLAHFFFDYTYRNLSVTANRRLFIDADGKPADSDTLAALNPIMYLPMKDADTAGSNTGTGGNFTAVGTLATAERGPNQDNCVASTFDGSNDYLSKAGIGAISSKTITFNVNWYQNAHKSSEPHILMGFSTNGTTIQISGNKLIGSFRSSSGSDVVNFEMNNAMYTYPVFKIHESISMCIDVDDVNKCKMFINGQVVAATFSIVNAVNIVIPNGTIQIGRDTLITNDLVAANLGELYFDDGYIDLATDNPFWDSDTNRPNSVRKVIADTSVTPLIALPIVGNDAGNNLGSGGDFTVNSGPFTGARGGSEFWARSVKFSNAETQYLNMTSPSATSGKTFTLVMLINHSTGDNGEATIAFSNSSNIVYFTVESNTSNIKIFGRNSSGSTILSGQIDGISRRQNQWDIYLISGDMTNASKFKIYFNGVNKSIASGDWSTFTNDTLGLASSTHVNIGRSNATSGQFLTGEIGNVYFSNEYTDFSQEVNRNKFIDQLGFPADLGADGSNPSGNQPYIYATMPSSNLGKNAGSGPDFTPVASPIAGEDFIPS